MSFNSYLEEYSYLVSIYSSPNRHYHNLDHINFMLAKAEEDFEKYDVLYFLISDGNEYDNAQIDEVKYQIKKSIWYHYIYMNNRSTVHGSNEEQSANIYRMPAQKFYTSVYTTILSTANHDIDQDFSKHPVISQFITKSVLDLDLLGLSMDSCYQDYDNLLKEYSHLDITKANMKLSDFLRKLLNRKTIFYNSYYIDKYEEITRANIKNLM